MSLSEEAYYWQWVLRLQKAKESPSLPASLPADQDVAPSYIPSTMPAVLAAMISIMMVMHSETVRKAQLNASLSSCLSHGFASEQ